MSTVCAVGHSRNDISAGLGQTGPFPGVFISKKIP